MTDPKDLNTQNNPNNSNDNVIYSDNNTANNGSVSWKNNSQNSKSNNSAAETPSVSPWDNLNKSQINTADINPKDNVEAITSENKPVNPVDSGINNVTDPYPANNQSLPSLLEQNMGQPDDLNTTDNQNLTSPPQFDQVPQTPEAPQNLDTFVDPNHPDQSEQQNLTPPSFYNPNSGNPGFASESLNQQPPSVDNQSINPPQFTEPKLEPAISNSPENINNADGQAQIPPPPEFVDTNSSQSPPKPNNSNQGGGDDNLMIASLSGTNKLAGLKNYIFMAIGLLVAIGVIILVISFLNKQRSKLDSTDTTTSHNSVKAPVKKTEIVYWGLWEPESVMQPIIDEYQKQHPEVEIQYQMQSHKDYRTRLQAKLKSGNGPDIFRYHNTWLPMLKNDLDRDSKNLINLDDYYPVVKNDISIAGEVYGVPLEFDSLALYYNPRILTNAGVKVPATWAEVKTAAEKIVDTDENGKIRIGGIAMGTANNVDHFSDIIGLLMLQNGANLANLGLVNESGQKLGEDALNFYTLFARDATTWKKVWDDTMPNSTYAFATEKVAMMFAPSWRSFEIKEINPDLKFAVTVAPQLPGDQQAWATYWVEGVAKNSKHANAAWQFLTYLSQKDTLKKLYTSEATYRQMFGEPYPLKSMASEILDNSLVGAFVQQGDYAKSWYMSSNTDDSGLNDKLVKYYEDAINSLNQNRQISEVLPTLSNGINQILKEYGLVSTSSKNNNSSPESYPTEVAPTKSSANDAQI